MAASWNPAFRPNALSDIVQKVEATESHIVSESKTVVRHVETAPAEEPSGIEDEALSPEYEDEVAAWGDEDEGWGGDEAAGEVFDLSAPEPEPVLEEVPPQEPEPIAEETIPPVASEPLPVASEPLPVASEPLPVDPEPEPEPVAEHAQDDAFNWAESHDDEFLIEPESQNPIESSTVETAIETTGDMEQDTFGWDESQAEEFAIGSEPLPVEQIKQTETVVEPETPQDLDWGQLEDELSGSHAFPAETTDTVPPPAEQELDWGDLDEEDGMEVFGVTAEPAQEWDQPTKATAKNENLDDLWAAALEDDELADESFPDFSKEEVFTQPTVSSIGQRTPSGSLSSKYAPVGAQAAPPPPPTSNPYTPAATQFTDFSQLQPNLLKAVPQVPVAAAIYNQAIPQPTRPDLSASAASFSDKAKTGYASPYDLPDDFAKPPPRKRPTQAPTPVMTLNNQPPPRTSSLPVTGPPPQSNYGLPPNPAMAQQPPIPNYGLPQNQVIASQPPKLAAKPPTEGFFEDLPVIAKTRPSGRYTPQQTNPTVMPTLTQSPPEMPIQRAVPTNFTPPLTAMLQPPAKMSLYADDMSGGVNNANMAPPQPAKYSPAPTTNRYASGSAPATSNRYSPAPTAKPSAPQVRTATEPTHIRAVQPFAPRTSSPLTYHSMTQGHEGQPPPQEPQKQDYGRNSVVGVPALETVVENEAQIPVLGAAFQGMQMAVGNMTPPSARSGPASMSSSPRRRSNYLPATSSNLNETAMPPPPRRSQTSSPGNAFGNAQAAQGTYRPSSAQGMAPIHSQPMYQQPIIPSMLPSKPYVEVMAPHDVRQMDPLQRWRGFPVMAWGSGGSIVTAFPTYVPQYGNGAMGPVARAEGGQIKVRNANTLMPAAESVAQFPGPLKKGKKKELLAWFKTGIQGMETRVHTLALDAGYQSPDLVRLRERILLWQLLSVLVENDGALEGANVAESYLKLFQGVVPPVSEHDIAATMLPDAPTPTELGILRSHLFKGDREKAVWHAVDQRLWGPALLIASSLKSEIWKDVVQEFVRKEVRDKPMAALFQVFAGNWDESVNELVSVSAQAGFQMVNTKTGSAQQADALAGLEKWKETVLLILGNRSAADFNALIATGRILATYERFEAAHICFILAGTNAFFGGPDDPRSVFSLVGGDLRTLGTDFGGDLEGILLSEVYEYLLSLAPTPITPLPHLQAYKLYHAQVLAEHGLRTEAQQYCDSINTTIHSKTSRSPYYNVTLMQSVDALSKKLSQAPVDPATGWASMDKVSNSLLAKFNSFITGDDGEPAQAAGTGSDSGQFQRLMSDTPPMSKAPSSSDLYSAYQTGAGHVPPANSKYAPSNSYAPRRGETAPVRSKYDPSASYQPRTSTESSRGSLYDGRPSMDGFQFSPKRVGSVPPMQPGTQNMDGYGMPMQTNGYDPHLARPHSTSLYTAKSHDQNGQYSPNALPQPTTPFGATPSTGVETPAFPTPGMSSSSASAHVSPTAQAQENTYGGYQPYSAQPVPSFDAPSTYEPGPSSYEPPSYEGGYQPYEPEQEQEAEQEAEDAPKPKKKGIMDDDDDDELLARAAALKNNPKTKADREADEAFRKAAEADGEHFIHSQNNLLTSAAKRPPPPGGNRSSWFGGWFGGAAKKEGEPGKPIRAKLGEANSFVFDPDLGKWVNKAAGASPASSEQRGTPPPPKSLTPKPVGTGGPLSGPSALGGMPPPMSRTSSLPPLQPLQPPTSAPPGSQTRPPSMAGPPPPGGLASGPPSGPSSRPSTSMGLGASNGGVDADDFLGSVAPRTRGGPKPKRKGRYVDVMAK
jgi:hypothetical protein